MRDRLIELIKQGVNEVPCKDNENIDCTGIACKSCEIGGIADHLIANGVILLPCKEGDILPYDGTDYKIDHWNVLATAFSEDKKLHIFSIEEAEKALKEKENV